MSANKYLPHVHVLPEDDAIRQMAVGFQLDPVLIERRMQILPPAGGWSKVESDILNIHGPELLKHTKRFVIGLIDFDGQADRLTEIRKKLSPEYADRVFILGISSEAEELKRALSLTFENIGKALAVDCRSGSNNVWGHDLLTANAPELARLRTEVSQFLFATTNQ